MKFEFYFIDAEGFQFQRRCVIEVGYGETPADVIEKIIYTKTGFKPIHPDWCDELFTYGGSTFFDGKSYAHVKSIGNDFCIYKM